MEICNFYLGTHIPTWIKQYDMPMFLSHRVLSKYKRNLPQAKGRWACDSGGFSELSMFGEWRTSPKEYVTYVRRYMNEIGNMDWAAPQDAMCEPWILDKAKAWLGGTVEAHQRWTVYNYMTLQHLAEDVPFIPVLQGWDRDDYMRHIDMYEASGIDLSKLSTVGIGSVCRRQATNEIFDIVKDVHSCGIKIHGFGVKINGLAKYGHMLHSADSMAWSFGGRRIRPCPQRELASCANCYHHATEWRDKVIGKL